MSLSQPKRIIVAISGASGAVYGVRLLEVLRGIEHVRTHLVVSGAGWLNVQQELDMTLDYLEDRSRILVALFPEAVKIASATKFARSSGV